MDNGNVHSYKREYYSTDKKNEITESSDKQTRLETIILNYGNSELEDEMHDFSPLCKLPLNLKRFNVQFEYLQTSEAREEEDFQERETENSGIKGQQGKIKKTTLNSLEGGRAEQRKE